MRCTRLNTSLEKAGQELYFPGIYNMPIKATELPELPRARQFVMLPIAFNIRTFFYCFADPWLQSLFSSTRYAAWEF